MDRFASSDPRIKGGVVDGGMRDKRLGLCFVPSFVSFFFFCLDAMEWDGWELTDRPGSSFYLVILFTWVSGPWIGWWYDQMVSFSTVGIFVFWNELN